MSLRKYLEDNKIDRIENDSEFMEAEYNAVKTYCENCRYSITNEDLEIIKSRGLKGSYINWKLEYIKDLWGDFADIPMNLETEKLEKEWNGFPIGTQREDIWHWFEETFSISVGEDLMGCEEW